MKNINIFFDTNSVKQINSVMNKFEFNKTYYVIKNFIIENELNNIKVYIPRIVIDEIIQQYIEDYKKIQQLVNDEVNKIREISSRLCWKIEIKKDFDLNNKEYIKYINEEAEKFINKEKKFLNIVEYPSQYRFNKILKRAILKKKPFFGGKVSGKNGKEFSDAGFKDVVFLESIIEVTQNLKEDFFIITQDKYLGELNFEKEVEQVVGKVLNYDTGKKVVEYFKREMSLEDYSKYIKFVKSQYYKEAVQDAIKCKLINNYVSIDKEEYDNDIYFKNTSLVEINEKNKEIIVKLSEENDLIEIIDKETGKTIYEW